MKDPPAVASDPDQRSPGAGRGYSRTVAPYTRRVVDDELDELLTGVSALALEGPRGVGKTATALQRARTVYALDDTARRRIIEAEPQRATQGPSPVLVDEWQRVPETWDVVRRAVDEQRSPGRFLLTGSAAPLTPPTHSGAARIVSVRMRPLSMSERGLAEPTVSLSGLLAGDATVAGRCEVSLDTYTDEILASGFPGFRGLPPRAVRAELDGYLTRALDRDISDQGILVRAPGTLRRWLTAYASATATTTTYERLRNAAAAGEGEVPARGTTIAYRRALENMWLLDPLPGWLPTRNHLSRLATPPKHHLADPALAARLLRIDSRDLLAGAGSDLAPRDGTFLGALFESLATLSVLVYAQACEARVGHLRTKGGDHEVDLIVEGAGGRVVGIEVKLSRAVGDDEGRHLRWLASQLGPDVADLVIITTGPEAYRRRDGIAIVPLALLGP